MISSQLPTKFFPLSSISYRFVSFFHPGNVFRNTPLYFNLYFSIYKSFLDFFAYGYYK